ncbi:MAG: N(G),N(G)-dimethylarginine dimethylaminohydrolase [Gammaproteobacteria bacterium]|nr:MAG: N(G),N(G)-dimethylarginine dimethylaminohydrolase [Gammaproteobacteria bacterium]
MVREFKHTIVRRPGRSLANGITSAPELGSPVYEAAIKQHDNYIEVLKTCGVDVTVLAANEDFPDSCFVEDNTLCTPNAAIISRPGAATRQKEVQLPDLRQALDKFYDNIEEIKSPGTIEPGDIAMVGNHYLIGLSDRTNKEGASQMIALLEKYGMSGEMVEMRDMLHFKTGMSYLENNIVLVLDTFAGNPVFERFDTVIVPSDEAYAANSIWINDTVITPAGYPKVKAKLEALGKYRVVECDTSEFRKVDGGLSCLSLRF